MNLNKILTIILVLLIILSISFTFIINKNKFDCEFNPLSYGIKQIEKQTGEELLCSCYLTSNNYNHVGFYFDSDGISEKRS